MYQIDDWREVIKMPVINFGAWSLRGLQEALISSIRNCVQFCLKENNGNLIMTLSGGLDSALFLAIARNLFPDSWIETFVIARSRTHPDIHFSRLAGQQFSANKRNGKILQGRELYKTMDAFEQTFPGILYRSGDLAVFALYDHIRSKNVNRIKHVIALDGVDELHGGYWFHRMHKTEEETNFAFKNLWKELGPNHLEQLARSAGHFGITPVFPYLQWEFVEYSAQIPVLTRTSREESKILIRQIARNFGVPEEIINRKKIGFCDALKPSAALEAELAKRR